MAGGLTPFSRAQQEADFRELCRQAFASALGQLPDLSTDDIDAAVMAYYSDYFTKQSSAHLAVHDYLGLAPRPCIRVDAASASGGAALHTAYLMVQSGYAHVVVVLGFATLGRVSTNQAIDLLSLSSDINFEYPLGVFWSGFFGMVANRQIHELGWDPKLFDMVSIKNHVNATYNPYAQRPLELTPEEIHRSTLVSTPLRKLHCSLISEGAVCLVVANEEWAWRLTERPVRIAGIGAASDTLRLADRDHGQVPLLQHEDPRQYEKMYEQGLRYPGVHHFRATRIAAREAYMAAGIHFPVAEIDFAEITDAYANLEIATYEDLGFCPLGGGPDFLSSGAPMMPGIDYGMRDLPERGKLPVNPSGGLLACGHPIGVGGLMQAVFALWQLREELASRFADLRSEAQISFTPLQLERPLRGLVHSMAGTGTMATVTILESPLAREVETVAGEGAGGFME